MNIKQLDKLFKLDQYIKFYVPSTMDVDNHIDNTKYKLKVMKAFAKYFGGFTEENGDKGGWKSETKGVVKEDVTKIASFATTEQLEENISKVLRLARSIKKEMGQESIALEINNALYLI